MRPPRPISRRAFRLLSRGVLLACLLLIPLTAYFGLTLALPGGLKIALYGGSLNIQRFAALTQPLDLFFYPNHGALWWLPSVSFPPAAAPGAPLRFEVILPLWIPALLALAASLAASRSTPDPRLCPHCGYPVASLPPSTPCPECGHPLTPS